MDGESWFIVLSLIAVESTVFYIYFPFWIAICLSVGLGGITIYGAFKLEKYLGFNKGSGTVNT